MHSEIGRRDSLLVAACMALSGAAYVRWSQELRYELANGGYQRTLLAQFAHERGIAGVHLLHRVSPAGLAALALFVVLCVVTGILARRALGDSHGRSDAAAFAACAAVLPPSLLAFALWPDGRGRLTTANLLGAGVVLALAAAMLAWRTQHRQRAEAPRASRADASPYGVTESRHDPGRGWAIVLLVALVPLLLAVWWNGVDAIRGFDSLADHLPRAARWLRLARLSDESGTLLTPYYPGNFQLLVRWVLVLGTDAYAFLPSLLASVAALWALHGICRELGQPRWTAMVSVAAAASCSLVPYLSTTVEADTATTAFLLLAVRLLLRWRRLAGAESDSDGTSTDHLAPLAAMGACLGLAIGTKYSALPPALVLAAVAGRHALRRAHGRFPDGRRYLNARTFVVLAATFLVPLALTCGYWLVRNLVVHGNPLYPVATAGLPGVDMRYIIPVKPALASSIWARATYPWVQWDFVSVYDDGLGAAFASVALVAFVATAFRAPARGSPRRLVWWITVAAYALWIGTGSITARFGLFPLLLTFAFVGEAWREFEGAALKVVTLAAVLFGVGVLVRSLVVGAVYTTVMPPGLRGVPAVVDSLPPSVIFNATSAANRYPLLGRDYRHEVVTMFAPARPEDAAASRAAYMLLSAGQVPRFTSGATLVARGAGMPSGDTLSLWKTAPTGAAERARP